MNYSNGQQTKVGDQVVADGMEGVVVCDYDAREFLEGYQGWDMPAVELLGGGKLDSGVMVDTQEAGLVHYPEEDEGIIPA
jgi:hypothetical protein